jgi:sarcosine oxidase
MEQSTGHKLLRQCGGLLMCAPGRSSRHGQEDFVSRTTEIAKQSGIAYEKLSVAQLRTRFPQFNIAGDEVGYFEPEAGYLKPEVCVETQLELAKQFGATIHAKEQVVSIVEKDGTVTVRTNKNSYRAGKVIVTAGPWIAELFPEFKGLFKVYRQVLYWFDLMDPSQYDLYHNQPVFAWEFGDKSDDFVYGFPALDGPHGGLKVATEEYIAETTPDQVVRNVAQVEIEQMHERIRNRLPGLSGRCIRAVTCLYTETSDHRFVIDIHPNHRNVIVASPCSGHGFKHSAAIGEALAQLALTGSSKIDLVAFSLARFNEQNLTNACK